MPEFSRHVLEVLRQPLEDGAVRIARAARTAVFPARFVLVGAMNPCPCGFLGDPLRACRCTPQQIARYRGAAVRPAARSDGSDRSCAGVPPRGVAGRAARRAVGGGARARHAPRASGRGALRRPERAAPEADAAGRARRSIRAAKALLTRAAHSSRSERAGATTACSESRAHDRRSGGERRSGRRMWPRRCSFADELGQRFCHFAPFALPSCVQLPVFGHNPCEVSAPRGDRALHYG